MFSREGVLNDPVRGKKEKRPDFAVNFGTAKVE